MCAGPFLAPYKYFDFVFSWHISKLVCWHLETAVQVTSVSLGSLSHRMAVLCLIVRSVLISLQGFVCDSKKKTFIYAHCKMEEMLLGPKAGVPLGAKGVEMQGCH